jgi:hypothetical protein
MVAGIAALHPAYTVVIAAKAAIQTRLITAAWRNHLIVIRQNEQDQLGQQHGALSLASRCGCQLRRSE